MASIQSNTYDGRYLKLTVVEESTSISANTSTVRWTLESIGGNSNYYTIYQCRVVVNGQTVWNSGTTNWNSYNFPAKKGSTTGTITVGHNNDGTASAIGFELHGAVYYNRDDNKSGSLSLSTIPRYFTKTPTISLASKTETSYTFNWSTSETCSYIRWHFDGSSTWHDVGDPNSTSGSFTVNTGDYLKDDSAVRSYISIDEGSTHRVYAEFMRKDSSLWSNCSESSNQTYHYPYPNGWSKDIKIGDDHTINWYNPLNRPVVAKMISTNGTVLNTVSQMRGTGVSGFNDSGTINKMYACIPNDKVGTYYTTIYCSETNTTRGSTAYGTGTYKVKGTEVPTFSNFTYADTNSTVTGVTGNNQILLKGLSTPRVTISSANKMVANNSATAKSYTAVIDTLSKSVNYSTSDLTIDLGTIANSGTKRLTVTAYDSRTLYKEVYKDVTVMDYAKPVINATVTRLNNFEAQTTLKVAGTYTRLTIGNADKNTIQKVQYRYRETGGSWSAYTQITTTVNAGKFTCSDVILSLDNTKSFEFELQVIDKLQTTTATNTVAVGQAVFMISSNKKKCYINGKQVATLTSNNDFNIETNKSYQTGGKNILRNNGTATIISAYEDSIYFRPKGDTSTSNQSYIDKNGNFINNGRDVTAFLNHFSTKSLGSNGYQKLPSGLLIQWGNYTVSRSTTTEEHYEISYPTAFSSVFTVVACLSDAGWGKNVLTEGVGVATITNSNFRAVLKQSTGVSHSVDIRWVAFGII